MITLTEVKAAPLDHAEWHQNVRLTGAVSGVNNLKPRRNVEAEQMMEVAR